MKNCDFWDDVSADYNAYYRSNWSLREDAAVSSWLLSSGLTGRVLDIGCGTGYAGKILSQCKATVEGVDASPGMLTVAENTGVYHALHHHDLNNGPPPISGKFDAIVSTWGSLNYLRDPLASLSSLTSLLRPGGALLIMVFNRRSIRRLSRGLLGPTERYGTRGSKGEKIAINIPFNDEWDALLSDCDISLSSAETFGAFSGVFEWNLFWGIDQALTSVFPVGHMTLLTGEKRAASETF